MSNQQYIEMSDRYLMGTYGHFPLVGAQGRGCILTDCDGKEYIDLGSGIGVNALGYCDEQWVDAVCRQVHTLNHVSNYFYTVPAAEAARKLVTAAGMSRVFFGNSGAEANEGAIKLARKYSCDKYGEQRTKIITLNSSFHGRTVTTLEATGQDVFHHYFFPFAGGFLYSDPDMDSIRKTMTDEVCAVMIELIQGEGGVNPLDKEFVQQLRAFTQEHDLALIVDEVQTGIGRTGKLFAYQQYGIQPDIVSSAKGLAGGLPIGAFLCNEKYSQVLGASHHGSTFGGNPISCAGANVVLDRVCDPAFLQQVEAKGHYIVRKIMDMKSDKVKAVKGMGLMLGIQLEGVENKAVCSALFANGVLALTAGHNVLRLLPPLVISYEEIDRAMEILEKVLKEA
ncbi:MAG: aspartate aminotransferase family protein [Eubacteriales bacterium]